MLLKKSLVILCLSSTLLSTSCGAGAITPYNQTNNAAQEINNPAYQVNLSSYVDNSIKIFYPQLSSMSDTTKQEKINDLIKYEALKILDLYVAQENFSADINYDIKLCDSKSLSIVYSGVVHPNKTAYPLNAFYTTNLDLNAAEKIGLADFIDINNELVKQIKEAKYVAWDSGLNSAEELVKKDINTYDLVEILKNSDNINERNSANAFSYFTDKALGISLGVTHAIGDHAEFEIDYSDLKDLLRNSPK
ncbi:MAG: DUF4163 domain-containing protein [Clostridiales bacterium]|jgi:hypothetical protein|nr:DUF4163 domain-containing protein [Clostridiales bacterium]